MKPDTTKSDAIVSAWKNRSPLVRGSRTMSGTWQASPADVFPLLCPSREADWIPGWSAEILHSSTGYAELGCVFRTDANCSVGPGVWVITEYEKDRVLGFVRLEQHVLTHARIVLEQGDEGSTTGTWSITVSALDGDGNTQVDSAPAGGKAADALGKLIGTYLETGKMAKPSLVDRIHAHIGRSGH
jgi:hypothetical protein